MKIHHLSISVKNLQKSAKFYIDNFGFRSAGQFARADGSLRARFIKLDNLTLELLCFSDMKNNSDDLNDSKIRGIRHIAFEVDDIDKEAACLKKKGLNFTVPRKGSSGHRFSFFNDPDGVVLELFEK